MIAEINALLSSVRTLGDIVKANKSLRNFNELETAVFEVHTKLSATMAVALAAQEKQATFSQRISELEKEITQLKNWDRERERYQLTHIAGGLLAYCLKPGVESDEPPHHLCANCFAHNEKSILQMERMLGGGRMCRCLRCKSTLVI